MPRPFSIFFTVTLLHWTCCDILPYIRFNGKCFLNLYHSATGRRSISSAKLILSSRSTRLTPAYKRIASFQSASDVCTVSKLPYPSLVTNSTLCSRTVSLSLRFHQRKILCSFPIDQSSSNIDITHSFLHVQLCFDRFQRSIRWITKKKSSI